MQSMATAIIRMSVGLSVRPSVTVSETETEMKTENARVENSDGCCHVACVPHLARQQTSATL